MQQRMVRFLLVEDDDDHAELVLRTMERSRITNNIIRVRDGFEALACLRQEGDFGSQPMPDVVLLDLKLPRLDGHEVLAEIKQDPELHTLPVVVMTTSDAASDRARAYEHHANSYVVKPIDFACFRQLIDDLSLYWGTWNRPALD